MRKRYPARGSFLFDPDTQVRRPVFAFDIDGTLGNYHGHFMRFAQEYLGRELAPWQQYDGTRSFAQFIGVSKSTYRTIKLAYRRGGMKRSMPAFIDMIDVVRYLRGRGAEIVIATTRPYLSLENIDGDTRHWLKRNGVPHDEVMWGEHKYRDLIKARPGRVIAAIDDLPEMMQQAEQADIKTTLMVARAHNISSSYPRHNYQEVFHYTVRALNKWEKENR